MPGTWSGDRFTQSLEAMFLTARLSPNFPAKQFPQTGPTTLFGTDEGRERNEVTDIDRLYVMGMVSPGTRLRSQLVLRGLRDIVHVCIYMYSTA